MTDKPKAGCRKKGCLAVVIVALGVGLFLGRELYIAYTATPGSSVDYTSLATELIESHQPGGGVNGWDALLLAVGAFERAASDDEQRDWWTDAFAYVQDPSEWEDEEGLPTGEECIVIANRALDAIREQGAFEALDMVAAAPRYVRSFPPGAHLIDLPRTEIGQARKLSEALVADMAIAHSTGDEARVVRGAVRGLALARAIAHQDSLIGRIVGNLILIRVTEEMRAEMVSRPFDGGSLNELEDALDLYPFPPHELAVEGERLAMLDLIQATHTDDGQGNGRAIPIQLRSFMAIGPVDTSRISKLENLRSWRYPSKEKTTGQAQALFDLALKYATTRRQNRAALGFHPDEEAYVIVSRRSVVFMFMPSIGSAIDGLDLQVVVHGGTRIMLAIERFARGHGEYPRTLDEVTPEFLDTLPNDPFATDGRFIYRRIDPAADPLGRGYLLYSVGHDGTDQGGVIDTESPFRALSERGQGYDFVFNLPKDGPAASGG